MNRRQFLQISGGVLGPLALGTQSKSARARRPLPASYLERGLQAMARTEGWFDAHWGAGVIAGYYLCKENALDQATVEAIRSELDVLMRGRPRLFAGPDAEKGDPARVDAVAEALRPALAGGLRAHGHAVIFASLATRALRDLPHMARPKLIAGLCGLSRAIARRPPRKPADGSAYGNTGALVDATFRGILRFEGLVGYPQVRRPNFTHWLTHTDAIVTLEAQRLGDLAKAAHPGHRAHLDEPVPAVGEDPRGPLRKTTLAAMLAAPFWTAQENTARWRAPFSEARNPNGDWIASGHLFKLLYALSRLARRIGDAEVVQRCSAVVLERYVDPNVRGG